VSAHYPSDAAVAQVLAAADADAEPAPAEVLGWLARLRLLAGVPFAYLVGDERLLPPESIRFFFLDRNWTDAMVDGALSAGATTTRERGQIVAGHEQLRNDLDATERDVWAGAVEPGARYPASEAETITGFLLRSRLVSGWPGLHVRAFHDAAVRILRIERLSPAVLLALFDGQPSRVVVEEPRQGLQFGVDLTAGVHTVERRPPDTGPDVTVLFRPGGSGVIDVRRLHDDLGGEGSAAFAARIVQYPYRQEFAGTGEISLFTPSISLEDLGAVWEESP
jgi:hypothetical protein